MQNINPKCVDYLLGLFSPDHLDYVDENPPAHQPTLADMVETAVNVLDRTPNGYFLFVEGGKIDLGHHDGNARTALTEGIEFDRAISKALSLVDLSETLIVVTADHSHTMTIGGYLGHEKNLLGLSEELALDDKTYTSIQYANGKGVNLQGPNGPYSGSRANESEAEVTARGYRQQATGIFIKFNI